MSVALFGGAFDPPHVGHVALLEAARERFKPDGLRVFVIAEPGHRDVVADAPARLRLAQAAFPDAEVVLDDHPFTVDMLRDLELEQPLFLIGADEWRDFATWKEPDEVLRLARLGVGTRAGVEPMTEGPDRVTFFHFDSPPVSSREIRARVGRGVPIDGLVPPPVADLIQDLDLYRR
ncbi:MAG: adenylyltransferase/cytidyltransferase family protein [Actinomycetota bacterium]|nr:adenylyltransferase/cytidyltransferase family protein [Actinomycetota bacterium]